MADTFLSYASEDRVEETLRVDPGDSVKRFVNPNLYRDRSVTESCAEALRSGGMPEA